MVSIYPQGKSDIAKCALKIKLRKRRNSIIEIKRGLSETFKFIRRVCRKGQLLFSPHKYRLSNLIQFPIRFVKNGLQKGNSIIPVT